MNLRNCKTREEIDKAFSERGISADNFEAKNAMLLDVMDNPTMFYSSKDITNEQKYEMILVCFLDGEWKYAEALDKIDMESI